MFGSVILDVAVGLVLIYLLMSLIATAIREGIAGILNTRAKTLHDGLHELLADPELVRDLYNHPMIRSLYRGKDYDDAVRGKKLPGYIPAKSFSAALVDMIVRGRDSESVLQSGSEARVINVENVRAQITRIENRYVQRAILSAVDSANGDLNALYKGVEHWFDSTMDRVSGWYKRHTQFYLFLIGVALAALADVDSVRIARRLYADPATRQAALAIAENIGKDSGLVNSLKPDTSRQNDTTIAHVVRVSAARLDSVGSPLSGWHWLDTLQSKGKPASVGEKAEAIWGYLSLGVVVGWLITALAVSLGAPFWFDTLGRIMVIRNTVKPTQKSPNEASDDRQVKEFSPGGGRSSAGGNPPSAGGASSAPPAPPPPSTATAAATVPPTESFTPHEWAAGHPDAGVI